MAKYPDRRSAAIPALHAAQELHGWCSPEAIEQVAAVMQLTPAYLTSVATFYDMLETAPQAAHTTCTCARTSRARCAAPTSSSRRWRRPPPRRTPTSTSARSSASARATSRRWRRSTASTSARSSPTTPSGSSRTCTPGAPVLEHKQLRYRPCADPGVAEAAPESSARRRPRPTDTADTAGLGPEGDTDGPPGSDGERSRCRPKSQGPSAADGVDADESRRRTSSRTPHEDPVRPHRRARPEHARRSTSAAAATRRCARR